MTLNELISELEQIRRDNPELSEMPVEMESDSGFSGGARPLGGNLPAALNLVVPLASRREASDIRIHL